MVEGTPLLREHAVKNCIEGSNPAGRATELGGIGLNDPSCELESRSSWLYDKEFEKTSTKPSHPDVNQ